MKVKKIFGFFVFAVCLFFPLNCFSKVTTNKITSYTIGGQGILPNSGYTPVSDDLLGRNAINEGYIIIFGLNIASDSDGTTNPFQRLVSVTLNMTGNLSIDSSVIITRGRTILGYTSGTGTITIPSSMRPILPANDTEGNAGDDFFIAIRTSDTCLDRNFSTFSIYSVTGVSVTPGLTGDISVSGAVSDAITCELVIADILPELYDNAHSIGIPQYPPYYQWQPGEMIRPRYDWTPLGYQYSPYPLLHRVPQVIPWETLTPVIAIGCSQRNVTPSGEAVPHVQDPPEALNSITLTITDIGLADFDPNRSFRFYNIEEADVSNPLRFPGITLWRDSNDNGEWEPTDTLLRFQMTGFTQTANPREWTVSLYPTTIDDEIIEPLVDNLYDYFIVIQLRSDDGYPTLSTIGGDYKIWLQPGGVEFGPISHPSRYAGIDQSKVKTIYNNIYIENIAQNRVDPTNPNDIPDNTSNVIPVFGLNIAAGPSNLFPGEQIQRIRIDLLAVENFDPNDLGVLRDDNYSGITLWRDNKAGLADSQLGSFDSTDTLVPCKFSSNPYGAFDYHWADDGFDASGAHRYHTYLVPTGAISDTGWVLSDDLTIDTPVNIINGGDDFFICIRSNNTLSYGSKFFLQIPQNEIWLTGSKQASASHSITSTTITGNVYAKITGLVIQGTTIPPQSGPIQVMRVDLTDNSSGKNPSITGITVEFYNKGGFTLDDLASFAPIVPMYDASSNWFNVTNMNPESLKQCGVVIYKGTSTQIDWNSPVLIRRYKYLTSTLFNTPTGYQFEFQSSVSIPSSLYVVIRTSASMSPGDAFNVGIVSWGRTSSDWNTWGSRAIPIIDATGTTSNSYPRKYTEAFNSTTGGSFDLYATPGFDGITLNWSNRTNISEAEFIRYEIHRTDSIRGETGLIVIPVPGGWSANSYFDIATREGGGGLLDGVTYTYRLVMVYERQGQIFTIESNSVSSKIYGFPYSMRPSEITAVASSNAIAIWFQDNSSKYPPYKATHWRIERKVVGQDFFTDITTVDTVATFYNPYLDTSAEFDVVYQYRVIALRDVNVQGKTGTAESYPSKLSDPAAIYGEDSGTGPIHAPSGGGGGCFIATAAFGSPLAKQIDILRKFRDTILLKSVAGRRFVAWYYKHSPAGAQYINQHPFLKFPVRILLYPLIGVAWILLHRFSLYCIVIIGLMLFVHRLKIIRQK